MATAMRKNMMIPGEGVKNASLENNKLKTAFLPVVCKQ